MVPLPGSQAAVRIATRDALQPPIDSASTAARRRAHDAEKRAACAELLGRRDIRDAPLVKGRPDPGTDQELGDGNAFANAGLNRAVRRGSTARPLARRREADPTGRASPRTMRRARVGGFQLARSVKGGAAIRDG